MHQIKKASPRDEMASALIWLLVELKDTRPTWARSAVFIDLSNKESLLPEERRPSAPSPLHNDGPCHNVIHSPVVLEEEERDEDGKEESNGEVLIKGPHSRTVKGGKKRRQKQFEDPHTDVLQVIENIRCIGLHSAVYTKVHGQISLNIDEIMKESLSI